MAGEANDTLQLGYRIGQIVLRVPGRAYDRHVLVTHGYARFVDVEPSPVAVDLDGPDLLHALDIADGFRD